MNRVTIIACLAGAALACTAGHALTEVDSEALSSVACRYFMSVESGTPGTPDYRFIYSDRANHIHVYETDKGSMKMAWESTTLGSRATSLFVTDLYGDGDRKLLISTIAGRVLIYKLDKYELEWENLQQRYTRIDFMASANLDGDRQEEVVILADDHLYIFDGYNRNVEWSSTTNMIATYLVIGNVDDDPQLEIVLNSGIIVDSRFYNIQFQTDQGFGDRLSLLDVTNDGFPEVIGEFGDRTLRVFDVWRGREVW
jgi:hypothetical protein